MAFLIVILVNQLGIKIGTSSGTSLNLPFSSFRKFAIGLLSKMQEWDCKMKHRNEMLTKNRTKLVFKALKSINY